MAWLDESLVRSVAIVTGIPSQHLCDPRASGDDRHYVLVANVGCLAPLGDLVDRLGWTRCSFAQRTGVSEETIVSWTSHPESEPDWLRDYITAMIGLRPAFDDLDIKKQLLQDAGADKVGLIEEPTHDLQLVDIAPDSPRRPAPAIQAIPRIACCDRDALGAVS